MHLLMFYIKRIILVEFNILIVNALSHHVLDVYLWLENIETAFDFTLI